VSENRISLFNSKPFSARPIPSAKQKKIEKNLLDSWRVEGGGYPFTRSLTTD
jgi:hypothetical protein